MKDLVFNYKQPIKIKVVNRKDFPTSGEYIGRPSPLGNPFKIGRDGSREQTIEKYRRWLWTQIQQQTPAYDELRRLATIACQRELDLICWCAPLQCHGDVIKNAITWLQQEAV